MRLIDELCYMVAHEVCSSRWWELVLPFIRMLVNLLAEKEIVGSLAIQVFTASRGGPMMFLDVMVQPLDILVVPANTSLASLLYLTHQKLDLPLPAEDSK